MKIFNAYAPNVISMGGHCTTRYQIERYLRCHYPGLSYPSFFWDWLFLGGSEGVAWCLENDFDLDRQDFYVDVSQPGGELFFRHRPSGLAFLHDFGGGYHSEEEALDGFERESRNTLDKYSFLASRTRHLINSGIPLTFLYLGRMSLANAERISVAVSANKGAGSLVNVLQVGQESMSLNNSSVPTFFVDDLSTSKPAQQQWQGCDSDWDKVFASLGESPRFVDLGRHGK